VITARLENIARAYPFHPSPVVDRPGTTGGRLRSIIAPPNHGPDPDRRPGNVWSFPVANTFRCRLVTPAASLLDSEVTYASIPAWDGLMGFLPGRAPILARLGTGELSLTTADKAERSFFVDGGFVQMNGQTLTVLAERATPKDQLNTAEIQAELKSLEARTIPENTPNRVAQVDALNKDRERARVKLRVAGGR